MAPDDAILQLGAALRDASNPAPEGLEPSRLAVYRELAHNALRGVLRSSLPLCWHHLPDQMATLTARYLREARTTTPYSRDVAGEFVAWWATVDHGLPAWAPALASWEHLCRQLDMAEDPDPWVGWSPLAIPLQLDWAVHQVTREVATLPQGPAACAVLLWRDGEGRVRHQAVDAAGLAVAQALAAGAGVDEVRGSLLGNGVIRLEAFERLLDEWHCKGVI